MGCKKEGDRARNSDAGKMSCCRPAAIHAVAFLASNFSNADSAASTAPGCSIIVLVNVVLYRCAMIYDVKDKRYDVKDKRYDVKDEREWPPEATQKRALASHVHWLQPQEQA